MAATQEIVLRFKGDPAQLKSVITDLKTSYGRFIAEITDQAKVSSKQMADMWAARDAEIIASAAKVRDTKIAYDKDTAAVATQVQREIGAAYSQRAAEQTAKARSEAAAWARHENQKLAATKAAERQGEAAVSATNAAKERSTRESGNRVNQTRKQQNAEAAANIKRFEAERHQIATANTRAMATLAKTEADTRIREGRRAATSIINSLRQEAAEVARVIRAQSARASSSGAGFLAGAAGGLSALVGLSAANEIRQAASAWLDYSSNLESTKIAFTTMLGSAEAAQQHLNELQSFALKTPFQFEDLISASQRMHALGVETSQVLPLLESVGNAVASAGGGKERLDRVVLALSQIQSKGKVATQELNQLAESGISGFKILEAQLGKTRAELVKMVEKGEISSQVFLDAFQKFSKQNFGGLMEAQSKTFSGAMSNIKDALLQTSATAFAPLYQRLSELAQQFGETATKSKEFREEMANVGKVSITLFDGLGELYHILKDTASLFAAGAVSAFSLFTHTVFALADAIHALVLQMSALAKAASGDFIGAFQQQSRAAALLRRSHEELGEGLKDQFVVWNRAMQIWDEAAARATAAAVRVAQAGVMISAKALPAGFEGVSAGVGKPKGTGTTADTGGSGGSKAKGTDPAATAIRMEALHLQASMARLAEEDRITKQSLDRRLFDFETYAAGIKATEAGRHLIVMSGLEGELESARKLRDTRQREVAVREIEIKQIEETNRHKKAGDELDDKKAKVQEDITAGLKKLNAATAENVITADKYQQAVDDLVASLAKQGVALPPVTEFWLRFDAAVAGARDRVLEAAKAMREQLLPELTLPDIGEDEIARRAGAAANAAMGDELPPALKELTLMGELMDSIQGRMQGFTDFIHGTVIGAFHAMTEAVGESIAAWALYGESIGLALKKALAQILAQVAAEAAIQALLHAAYAIGRLAFGDVAGATQHGIAALKFAAVAAAAGVGAKLVGNSVRSANAGAASGAVQGATGGRTSGSSTPKTIEADRRGSNAQTTIIQPIVHVTVTGQATEGFRYMVEKVAVESVRENGVMRKIQNGEFV